MRAINRLQDEAQELKSAAATVVTAAMSIPVIATELREQAFRARRMLAEVVETDERHHLLSDESRELVAEMHGCADRAFDALDDLSTLINRAI